MCVTSLREVFARRQGRSALPAQLIDAVTGTHIWADRFERDLTDIFALQDEVTVSVVSAIQPKLLETEIEIASRRPPESVTAYDLCLRSRQKLFYRRREGLAEAVILARRALELDPKSALAAALAAQGHLQNVIQGFSSDPQYDRNEAARLIRLALSLDENDGSVLRIAAWIAGPLVGDYETAIDYIERAVASNPNDPEAWNTRGWMYKYAGKYAEAVLSFERAIQLGPLDPLLHTKLLGIGAALIERSSFDEAVAVLKKAFRLYASDGSVSRLASSALAHLGRDTEAREAAARLLEFDPSFTISGWIARGGQENSKQLIEGLRKAGLPE